jgi:putative membrane protein
MQSEATDRRFLVVNAVLSSSVIAFLAWLLFADRAGVVDLDLRFLPAVNASLNATAFVCMVLGWIAIRRGRRDVHPRFMVAALVSSSLFLVSYVVYHFVHGDTRYAGYYRGHNLAVLASHVHLSIETVPLAIATVYYAWQKRFERHRAIARITLPVWLYDSASRVLDFFLLRGSPSAH